MQSLDAATKRKIKNSLAL